MIKFVSISVNTFPELYTKEMSNLGLDVDGDVIAFDNEKNMISRFPIDYNPKRKGFFKWLLSFFSKRKVIPQESYKILEEDDPLIKILNCKTL